MKFDTEQTSTYIINRFPPPLSPYRYAVDVESALKGNGVIINLHFEKNGWSLPHNGMDFDGKFTSQKLNVISPKISFHNAKKYIENNQSETKVVHYTNQFSSIMRVRNSIEIISVHDSPYYLDDLSLTSKIYFSHLYHHISNVKHVIVQTNSLKKDLIEFGFTGYIDVIPLATSPTFRQLDVRKEAIRLKYGLPINKKIILSVSSDLPRKNLLNIKRASKLLGDEFALVRVGPVVADSFSFHQVDDQVLNELYNASDFLLFPSLYEGFGLPIIEAFAAGTPVITSNIPTIKEIAGNAAIFVDPNKPEEIAEGVRRATDLVDSLKRKGNERSELYSYHNFQDRILNYYCEILNKQ